MASLIWCFEGDLVFCQKFWRLVWCFVKSFEGELVSKVLKVIWCFVKSFEGCFGVGGFCLWETIGAASSSRSCRWTHCRLMQEPILTDGRAFFIFLIPPRLLFIFASLLRPLLFIPPRLLFIFQSLPAFFIFLIPLDFFLSFWSFYFLSSGSLLRPLLFIFASRAAGIDSGQPDAFCVSTSSTICGPTSYLCLLRTQFM